LTSPKQEYIVEPLKDDFVCTKNALSPMSIKEDIELLEFTRESENSFEICLEGTSIVQGQTIYFKVKVGSHVTALDISLTWLSTKNILFLTTYSPTGVSHGPYKPKSGSKSITLRIMPKTGLYLEEGYWRFKVFGESISGTEIFNFTPAIHKQD
jgi:hypothetical protein